MKNSLHKIIMGLLLAYCTTACTNKTIEGKEDNRDLAAIEKINSFSEQTMKDVYLWADQVQTRNISKKLDPEVFFRQMMYTEEDKNWSNISETDEGTKTRADDGESSYGYHLLFYRLSDEKIIAEIAYVYPESPAAKAGLKRGNIITKNNGSFMDINNYTALYSSSSVRLQLADIKGQNLITQEKVYALTTQRFEFDPVLIDTVLIWGQKKVGYLHYTEFVDNDRTSLNSLSRAIGKLKSAGIDELVLDLRYNPGGRLTAAVRLTSLLAPAEAVSRKALLITMEWNKKYQKIYGNNPANLRESFDPQVLGENLNLSRLYVLTGQGTASASEVLISGLRPYIPEIIQIGDRTVGKYVGSTPYTSTDSELKKWTLYPIVFSYKNFIGESAKGGIAPTYSQEDDTAYPLGSPDEPLLKAALNLIGGQPAVAATPSFYSQAGYTRIKSPYDEARQLLIRETEH